MQILNRRSVTNPLPNPPIAKSAANPSANPILSKAAANPSANPILSKAAANPPANPTPANPHANSANRSATNPPAFLNNFPINISILTNKQLYELCQNWGANARKWMKKFSSLIPEVEKRRLYKEHGFYSIYEFAAKLGGMSNAAVTEVLRVSRKVDGMPHLKKLIPTEGWSKVKVVASIATKENEKVLARRVKEMPKVTLVTFVRELKRQEAVKDDVCGFEGSCDTKLSCEFGGENSVVNDKNESRAGAGFPQETAKESQVSVDFGAGDPQTTKPKLSALSFKVSVEVEEKLRVFKHKLEKRRKTLVTWNEVMAEFLRIVDGKIKNDVVKKVEKTEIKSCSTFCDASKNHKRDKTVEAHKIYKNHMSLKNRSRYIPVKIKRQISQQYKGVCAYPNCKNASTNIHHTRRFSLDPNHDPQCLVPLCKNHHQLAHQTLIKNENAKPQNWQVQLWPENDFYKRIIDEKMMRKVRKS